MAGKAPKSLTYFANAASSASFVQKYTESDFMQDSARPTIKELIKRYLQTLGDNAEKATMKQIFQTILSETLYQQLREMKKQNRQAYEKWTKSIDAESVKIFDELSAKKDTTTADSMDATRSTSTSIAGTQPSPQTEVLLRLREEADELRKTMEQVRTHMSQCSALLDSLWNAQAKADDRAKSLLMELDKAVDAQMPAPALGSTAASAAAGATFPVAAGAAQTQTAAPALGSTAVAEVTRATLSVTGASASALTAPSALQDTTAGKKKRNAGKTPIGSAPRKAPRSSGSSTRKAASKKVHIDYDTAATVLDCLFESKYPDREKDVTAETQKRHIRTYLKNFVLPHMQELLKAIADTSKYDTKDLVLQSLMKPWEKELKEYKAKYTDQFTPKHGIDMIKMHTLACEAIIAHATGAGQTKWENDDRVQTPLSKYDSFSRESIFISEAFQSLGVPCSKDATGKDSDAPANTVVVKKEMEQPESDSKHVIVLSDDDDGDDSDEN